MSERKHKADVKETHATKQVNEEERLPGYHPADALRKIVGAPPSTIKPAQILALQRTVGNKVVQRMLAEDPPPSSQKEKDLHVEPTTSSESVQRHPTDAASSVRSNLIGVVQSMAIGNLSRSVTNEAQNKYHLDILTKVVHKDAQDQMRSDKHLWEYVDLKGRVDKLESSGGGGVEEGGGGSEGGRSSRSRNRTSAPPY